MTSKDIKLNAQTRKQENGGGKQIREKSFIPAVLYGPGVNLSLKIQAKEFKHVFELAGESHLIDLVVDGRDHFRVIIKETQKDPIRGSVIHADFYKVDMAKKITTAIPLNFIGEPKAVKEFGGTLVKNIDAVEVKCLPGDLVDKIDVDLSVLNTFADSIRLHDLKLPEGMELVSETDETVAAVKETKAEEVAPAVEEVKEEAAPAEAAPKEGEAEKQ